MLCSVTVVVLVLSIVSIGAQPTNSNGDRIWTIGIGHDWGAHEYFDESGYIRGFSVELIAAVCENGGLDCRTMWTPYKWCWASQPGQHPYGGEGLADRWIDGCLGWYKTVDRIHVFDFSQTYLQLGESGFFTRPGETLDTSDLSGKTIAFISGWYSDEKCVARQQSDSRQNYILSTDQIVYAPTAEDILSLLLNNGADAIFAGYDEMSAYVDAGQIDFVSGDRIECALGASGMMTRKDSGFIAAWDAAFQSLKDSGDFEALCNDAQGRHALQGNVECLL